jgi:4-carboxymuconolactone decarboxylase
MKSFFFVALWSFLSLTSFGQKVTDEERVMDLSAKKWVWMINKNYDSLESLLHDRVTYIHSNGWSQNKKEFIEDLKSGKLVIKSSEISTQNAQIFSQTAIVNGMIKISGEVNGTPFSTELIFNEGYIKEKGKWLLVSRLATKINK